MKKDKIMTYVGVAIILIAMWFLSSCGEVKRLNSSTKDGFRYTGKCSTVRELKPLIKEYREAGYTTRLMKAKADGLYTVWIRKI